MKMEDLLASAGATALPVTSLGHSVGHGASQTPARPPSALSQAERTVSLG